MVTELLLLFALSIINDGDEALAARIKEGDKAAFKDFFQKHQSALISFLCSKGLDKMEAEDLLQQAFMIIWEKREKIKPGRSLRSYLFTIAYNRMVNHFRDQKHTEPDYAYRLEDGSANPHEQAETSEAMNRLQQMLEIMPEKRRAVFELCYMQEFTYKEAAVALNVSPKTIENHMAIALKEIREALKTFFPI
jgi:RNA polymerase sigma-70 factor (ECF subfamily)